MHVTLGPLGKTHGVALTGTRAARYVQEVPLEPLSPFCSRIEGLGMFFCNGSWAAGEIRKMCSRRPLIDKTHWIFDPLSKTHGVPLPLRLLGQALIDEMHVAPAPKQNVWPYQLTDANRTTQEPKGAERSEWNKGTQAETT